MKRTIGFAAKLTTAILAFSAAAPASTINFQFDVYLQTGHLAGTQFTGTASYNLDGPIDVGTEYVSLTSINFFLLGYQFSIADLDQGGQAILKDGKLQYFTAAFFPDAPAPVDDLVIGFGGSSVVGYSTPPGSNFGLGIETVIPEPPSLYLCFFVFVGLAAAHRAIIPRSGVPWPTKL